MLFFLYFTTQLQSCNILNKFYWSQGAEIDRQTLLLTSGRLTWRKKQENVQR